MPQLPVEQFSDLELLRELHSNGGSFEWGYCGDKIYCKRRTIGPSPQAIGCNMRDALMAAVRKQRAEAD